MGATHPMRAFSKTVSLETVTRRETLAAEISAVSDEHLRERLRAAMSNLFRSLEADLERSSAGRRVTTWQEEH
jgi:hypothetical protein